MNKNVAELQKELGITFNNPNTIEHAFIHRSHLNESKKFQESNERLEFLGDAILSFVVALYLYKRFPEATEGELTNYRASLVSRKFLGDVGNQLKLGEYLYLAKGEEEAGGRNNLTVLSNTYEALIGAVYLDQGIGATTEVIDKHVLGAIDEIISNKLYKDNKSELQEKAQSTFRKPPIYKVAYEEGPEHAKIFTVIVTVNDQIIGIGKGKSKQEAEQQAAKEALETI